VEVLVIGMVGGSVMMWLAMPSASRIRSSAWRLPVVRQVLDG
jgi:hypothetical protein